MNLLNPGYVWLLLLAVVPVILHFLLRERVQRVIFSTLRFLRRQHREVLRRKRWLEWLLTALRMACVALLVLAFARPFFAADAEAAKSKQGGKAWVVMVDVSRSMSYEADKRFEEAKKEAIKLIDSSDRPMDAAIRVVSFAERGSATVFESVDPTDARLRVEQLTPTRGGTDILDAMNRTFDSVAAASEGDIFLVSDLHATGMPKGRVPQLPKGFKFHVVQVGKGAKADGVALTGGSSYLEVLPGTHNFSISAKVLGFGKERDGVWVQALVQGKDGKETEVTSRAMRVPQNGEKSESLNGTLNEVGEHRGRLLLRDGGALLKGDDEFFFVVRVVKKIRVAVVNGNSDPSQEHRNDAARNIIIALSSKDTTTDSSPFEPVESAGLPDLKDVDVVVLSGVPKVSADDAKRLTEWVRNGGGLIASPPPNMSDAAIAEFNTAFGEVLPAKLRQWKPADGQGSYMKKADMSHLLWSKLNKENSGDILLETPKFAGVYELKDAQDLKPIFQFEDERPALLQKHLGSGSSLLFAAGLDYRSGTFPRCGVYVPFLQESVQLLAQRTDRAGQYGMGDSIPLPKGVTLYLPDGKQLEGAENKSHTIAAPGIYRKTGSGSEEMFAVNTNPEESDLRPMSADDLEKQYVKAADVAGLKKTSSGWVRVLAMDEKLRAEHSWMRFGFGWWALVGLIGLTVIEMWLGQVVSKR